MQLRSQSVLLEKKNHSLYFPVSYLRRTVKYFVFNPQISRQVYKFQCLRVLKRMGCVRCLQECFEKRYAPYLGSLLVLLAPKTISRSNPEGQRTSLNVFHTKNSQDCRRWEKRVALHSRVRDCFRRLAPFYTRPLPR